MLGKVIVGGLALFGAWEGVKLWKSKHGAISMQNGHSYAIALNYTKDPVAPVSQAYVQSILDAQSPGAFNVLSANMTPGAASGIRQMALLVQMVGPTQEVPASDFTSGWGADYGSVTLASTQDMGGGGGSSANTAAAAILSM